MNAMAPEPSLAEAGYTPGPADTFAVTFFSNFGASTKREEAYTLEALAPRIRAVTAASKNKLPWLKLATFGDQCSDKNSLRHDGNVLVITGVEADYDGERIGFDQAMETATKAGLRCLIYTSPSHTEAAPRWRILCPLSGPFAPDWRDKFMGRVNGLFGGVFSGESWALSQAYYFGSVNGNPAHRVEVLDGETLDELDELDRIWTGKPNTVAPATGSAPGTVAPRQGKVDEAALLREIVGGTSFHAAAVRLLGHWAFKGVPMLDARQRLVDAFEAVFPPDRDARWHQRFADIDRCTADIWGKEARAKDAGTSKRQLRNRAEPDAETGEVPGGNGGSGDDTRQGDPAADPAADDAGITEDGVALIFADRFKGQLLYCHTAGAWYQWNGWMWAREETKLAFSWSRQVARGIARNLDSKKVQAILGKAAFAAAVERFAQADRAFAVTSATFDTDPWLLGTPGGTVELRKEAGGKLRAAAREDRITKATAVAPAETADCPTWLAFLDQATARGKELIRFLRQWCGYCLTGDTREHALLFIYGPGGNGKSVFLNTVYGILGTYARIAAMETFTASQGDRHPTDLAMLRGARVVTASETEEGRAWAEVRIKQLTGGDTITARFMRQDFFEFRPEFKLTIIGNHKPVLRNVDDAARRRFNVVPFVHKPAKVDRDLETKLRAEWPGILRWMVEGCLDWQAHGLVRPAVVAKATAEYFSDQDTLGQWLEDCCERGRDGYGRAPEDTTASLFGSWRNYAAQRGEDAGSAKRFTTWLQRQGFEAMRDPAGTRNQRGFKGVAVKAAVMAENGE